MTAANAYNTYCSFDNDGAAGKLALLKFQIQIVLGRWIHDLFELGRPHGRPMALALKGSIRANYRKGVAQGVNMHTVHALNPAAMVRQRLGTAPCVRYSCNRIAMQCLKKGCSESAQNATRRLLS